MALTKNVEPTLKFIVEYKSSDGKVTDRWHYDLSKSKNGPILVENLELPKKERKSRKSD